MSNCKFEIEIEIDILPGSIYNAKKTRHRGKPEAITPQAKNSLRKRGDVVPRLVPTLY
jgi:hypothetical protein